MRTNNRDMGAALQTTDTEEQQGQKPGFEPWLTPQELAKRLRPYGVRISAFTLKEKARKGLLPSKKLNGRMAFRWSRVLPYFDEKPDDSGRKE